MTITQQTLALPHGQAEISFQRDCPICPPWSYLDFHKENYLDFTQQ